MVSNDPVEMANHRRSLIRARIDEHAGDTQSLLGTASDATQLLLYAFATLVTKLGSASTIAEIRASVEPFAELSQAFLAKIDSGEVKLTALSKGMEKVVADMEGRATAVVKVLDAVDRQTE